MTCAERRDLMPEYILGVLDAAEQAEVRAHLSTGCPECAGALAEAESSVASLAMSLPDVMAPTGLRDRLMNELSSRDPMRISPPPSGRRQGSFPWRAVAAAIAIAAT